MTKMFTSVLSLAALMVMVSSASGALQFFGEDAAAGGSLPVPNSAAAQASFLSALVGVGVEDFEGIAVGTQFPFNISFGLDTATLSGTNIVSNTGVRNTNIGGRFPISGSNYLNVGTSDALSFNMTFSSPQAAVGFFATDIGDIGGQLTLSFDGGPPVLSTHTVNSPNGAGLFFGIIDVDNPFTTVQFANSINSSDAFGFDDFTIGRAEQVQEQVIPEPSTLAIWSLLGGLGIIGWWRRRTH